MNIEGFMHEANKQNEAVMGEEFEIKS